MYKIFEKDYIVKSHDRCIEMGVKLNQIFSKKIISSEELCQRLEGESELILAAEPFMNQLYDFVKGSNFFSILTDRNGCILSLIGDEAILEQAFEYKMMPGAYMDEENIGTNAMGTALYEGRPVQVSGKEHFVEAYHTWTCSGAPIRDIDGSVIGCLDLTGFSENVHSHTLGMVVAAANAIEKLLQIKKYNEELSLAKIYTEAIVDSIPSAILTSDLNGKIKSVNKYAVELFGYSEEEMRQFKVWELFEGWENVKATLENRKSYLEEEVVVNSNRNKVNFALSAYPIYNSNGALMDFIYIFKDVKKVRKLANKIMGRRAIYTFDKIIGKDPAFLRTVEFAKKIADSKSTVLIMGESGTGKEIFAQAIQNHSIRKDEPFVAINCGAIPKNLIESELFGYEEGAFTGAKRSGQPGKFEIADGGTLFLDEIGEMPLDMQTRLLRVIEEGTVSRIGSPKEFPVDVRIIAATNKDLQEEVKKGNFRKDLFYRLNVLPIKLPPLRKRHGDIPALIDYFMDRVSKRLNRRIVEIPESYMDYLSTYDWPGNIRELENLIELIINTESIPIHFEGAQGVKPMVDKMIIKESFSIESDDDDLSLEEVEQRHIENVLKKCQNNITVAAKSLKIGRNTLYRKIKKYNIECSEMEQCSEVERSEIK